MLRYIVSKIVQEIVKSPQNKRFFDAMPDGLKDAYGDHDQDGVINYLDKDVDKATQAEWKKGITEYTLGQGDFKESFEKQASDLDFNKVDREALASRVSTLVRGVLFVVIVGYIIVTLILKS